LRKMGNKKYSRQTPSEIRTSLKTAEFWREGFLGLLGKKS